MSLISMTRLLGIISALTFANATPMPRQTNTIKWFDCKQNASIPIECGTLTVPLDYTDPASTKTIDLQLTRVNATQQPSKGSILFNPGGPGEIGRSFITDSGGIGTALLLMTGGVYDLIAFDPRGTGETIPFSCYPTSIDGEIQRLTSSLKVPQVLTGSNTDPGLVWAGKEILADLCLKNMAEYGELIGTAFVARDMMRIVDALNEDGLLRYWGFSYGTALGETVAAMFPDRMDKVVLDGVLNPEQYWSGMPVQQVIDSEAVIDGIFSGCVENPKYCALAASGSSAAELRKEFEDLLEEVKSNPIVLGSDISTDLVDYDTLKVLTLSALYDTSLWPVFAELLEAVYKRDRKSYVEASSFLGGILAASTYPQYAGPEALQGIRCSDSEFRANELSAVLPMIHELLNIAPTIGDIQATSVNIPCAAWKMAAKERYSGGFNNIKTKNPLLFVGNKYDPLTPLVSTRNASAAFDGSVVLVHDGYGHTSTAQPSLCVGKVVRAYFVDGTLPQDGTVCKSSVPTFYNTAKINLASVEAPLANITKRSISEAMDDDAALLAAWSHLGRRMSLTRRRF